MIYITSKINRYILLSFFKWFGICLLGIGAIIMLFEMIELLRRMMTRPHLTLFNIFEILLLRMPSEIQRMLPFIVLASSMLMLTRLNQRSEITAIRTSGISIWQILLGLMSGVFLFGLFNLTVIDPIRATFTERLYYLEEKFFGTKRNTMSINDAGLWLKDVVKGEERIFHAQSFDLKKGHFHDLSFYCFDEEGHFSKRIDAVEGELRDDKWILRLDEVGENALFFELPTLLTLKKIRESNAVPETLSFWQIPDFIHLLQKSGLSTLTYVMHYHKLIASIGLMMTMILLSAGFCLRSIRGAKTSHLISLCLLSGLFFHFISDFIYALGLGERLPPLLATWFPTLLGVFISLALLLHSEERRA